MKTKSLMMVGVIGVLLASSAQAQRVRDFSMPVDESINHATSNNKVSPNTIVQPAREPASPYRVGTRDSEGQGGIFGILNRGSSGISSRFMESYCDPSTQIGIAARSDLANCIAEQRKAACEQYASLPHDAKKVIDLTVDCAYAATDGAANELDVDPISMPRGCNGTAEQRLELLQTYYNDTYISHALLFLPETVLKGGASCVTGR